MPKKNTKSVEKKQPTILSYVNDLPNLLSLSGLACTVIAIYFSITGKKRCFLFFPSNSSNGWNRNAIN